jgi:hypothetical protein
VIRRFAALFCALAITSLDSAIAFPFNSAIADKPELCTVTKISDGSLSNAAASGQVRHLSSFAADGGISSDVDVNCSRGAKLTISVSQAEGDALEPTFVKAIATNRTNGVSTKSGETPLDLGVGTTRVSIDLVVDKPSTLMPGKYKFIVHMTFS